MAEKYVYYLQICKHEIMSHITATDMQWMQTYESNKENDGRRNVVTSGREASEG